MLRLIAVLLFLIPYLIISLPIQLVEWLLGKVNRRAADISSLRIVQWGFRVLTVLSGVKLTVNGQENIPDDHPVLYVANHNSFFDIVLTYPLMKELTGYIAKESVFNVPSLGIWMKLLYCLGLDRSDPRQGLKVILKAIDQVKEGISIFIFPEGTRSKDGQIAPFHAGSFKVATKSGCPIIPVAISNTSAILEDHAPFIRSQNVTITFGEPIDPNALDVEAKKHIGDHVRSQIIEMKEAQDTALIKK